MRDIDPVALVVWAVIGGFALVAFSVFLSVAIRIVGGAL